MIRPLKASEVHGLNMLPPVDWIFDYEDFLRRFLTEDFFYAFVIVENDQIVGTGNVLIKGKIGWLANIIVLEAYRGRGLGIKMTKFLVDFLKEKGCKTQLLIATALGEVVYQKIGFKKVTEYQCFDSKIDTEFNFSKAIRKLEYTDLEKVNSLDFKVNGEDRTHLLSKFYQTGYGFFNSERELLGFYLPDFGRGLIIAKQETVGIELLKLKHAKKGTRTMLPNENIAGINFLEQAGLKKGASCSKMILGKENTWHPENIYSYASGYCG